MIELGLSLVLAAQAQAEAAQAIGPCAGEERCVQASAGQLFALADERYAQGDLTGAEEILVALTQDPSPELRAEARFRLAAVREKRGDPAGAIAALRELLAEQPKAQRARLELSRLLAAQGQSREARAELQRAQNAGLPADVARTVSRYSNLLSATKRRGGSIELIAGPDSNINRSTSDQFLQTVIAPFELDPDARRQSGFGITAAAQGYSRDTLGNVTLLSRGGVRGDVFLGHSQFNDFQAYAGTGPEFATRIGRVRPALTVERRWFGGNLYSSGYGAAFSWIVLPSRDGQLELDASVVRQSINNNAVLDGTRYAAALTYDRLLSERTTARLSLRGAILDAAVRPESLYQAGAETVIAHDLGAATVFGSAGYTKTRGRAVLQLFGETRDDDRFDVSAGVVSRRTFAGFAPLLRISHTRSWSNIGLYDYGRTRLDLGISREF